MLRVRPQFSGQAAFETALRERLRRLAEFRNPAFARVRQIDRLTGQAAGIAIVSNHMDGVRLGDVMGVAESYGVRIDIDTTLCLIRQLVSAVAGLHTCGADISHGCIGPERLLLTPDARLVVTEYVLGGALEAMQWTRERFWQEFRIALPQGADPASFDQQGDIMQIGLLALALLEGRGVYGERNYPLPLAERVKSAKEIPVSGNTAAAQAGVHHLAESRAANRFLVAVPLARRSARRARPRDRRRLSRGAEHGDGVRGPLPSGVAGAAAEG